MKTGLKLLFITTILSLLITTSHFKAALAASWNYTVTSITDNSYDDYEPHVNNNGQICWWGNHNNVADIYLYSNNMVTQITNDYLYDAHPQLNNSGTIVWHKQTTSGKGQSHEIYRYSENSITSITNNGYADYNPRINASGEIVWESYQVYGDINSQEIYLYSNNTINRITNNAYPDYGYYINTNGQIAWSGAGSKGTGVYLYSKGTTKKLPESLYSGEALINDSGQVVYTHYNPIVKYDIWRYDSTDGSTKAITDNDYSNWSPQINNLGQVVWRATGESLGSDGELFFQPSKGTTIRLTDNDAYESSAQTHLNDAGHVVWSANDGHDSEIYCYFEGKVKQVTNNDSDDSVPRINKRGQIVWQGHDGEDTEIYKADLSVNVNPNAKNYGLFIGVKKPVKKKCNIIN